MFGMDLTKMITMKRLCISIIMDLFTGAMLLLAQAGWGCDIPVFRYALERWPSDPYHLFVFHRGGLSEEHNAAVDRIHDSTTANCRIYTIDLDDPPSEGFLDLWKTHSATDLPWVIIRYPIYSRIEQDLWSGPMDEIDPELLLDSPVRKEISTRILNGQTAVWILLKSGNAEKDREAKQTLETQLKRMMEMLRIPEPAMRYNTPSDPSQEMRVEFSMLEVSRDDEKEKFLIDMLMRSEADLGEYLSEPMAFPIYGRARVLFALVGKGINDQNIFDACAFLVGPCACEFKVMSPGTDLLMPVDWDNLLMEQFVSRWERSMIMGQAESLPESEPVEQEVASEETLEETSESPSYFLRNLFIIGGVIVLINVIVGFRIIRRRSMR